MSYYRYLGSHLFLDKLTPFICVNIEPTSPITRAKNVPRHILALSALLNASDAPPAMTEVKADACDIILIRANAHPAGGFCVIRNAIFYIHKKSDWFIPITSYINIYLQNCI